MKKVIIGLVISLFILVVVFLVVYLGFNAVIMKSELSKVEGYKLKKEEKVVKEFKYDKYKYVVTSYKTPEMKYSTNNFLLKYVGKYYYLDSFTDCDMSSYAKDNFLYVHCINYSGNIVKFKFYGTRVFNEIIELSYHKTPNIDQKNIEVTKVADDTIYLKSNKIDENVAEGDKVKCDFDTQQCKYDVKEKNDKKDKTTEKKETKKQESKTAEKKTTKKKDSKTTEKKTTKKQDSNNKDKKK